MSTPDNITTLVRLAAAEGAKAALETIEREKQKEKKSRHDRRLRNTKLLLRNYRMFKEHCHNAVFDASQLDENAIDILDLMCNRSASSNVVDSIKQSVQRTAIIMQHITDMLALYEAYCSKTGKPEDARRYRTVDALYIAEEPLTPQQIAEREGIDMRTVYKDIDAAAEKLSALIFGIDSLEET